MTRCVSWFEPNGYGERPRQCEAHAMKGTKHCRAHTSKPTAPNPKANYIIFNGRLGSPIIFPAAEKVRIEAPDGTWVELTWQNWDSTYKLRASNTVAIELDVSNQFTMGVKP